MLLRSAILTALLASGFSFMYSPAAAAGNDLFPYPYQERDWGLEYHRGYYYTWPSCRHYPDDRRQCYGHPNGHNYSHHKQGGQYGYPTPSDRNRHDYGRHHDEYQAKSPNGIGYTGHR